jgi:hypothetical protein
MPGVRVCSAFMGTIVVVPTHYTAVVGKRTGTDCQHARLAGCIRPCAGGGVEGDTCHRAVHLTEGDSVLDACLLRGGLMRER